MERVRLARPRPVQVPATAVPGPGRGGVAGPTAGRYVGDATVGPAGSSVAWLAALSPAGNRAITAALTIQRDGPDGVTAGDGPAPGPLTPAQVADARRFYTAQPWLYTPAIVTELRGALDLDPNAGIDDALVQAVATWQRDNGANDPALVVDGKAGPRTLPRIFRHGLNEEGEGETFGEAVQSDVIDEWATLATPEARRDRLVELVNERLTAHDVPTVGPAFDPDPVNSGSFNFPTWEMRVGRTPLAAAGLDTAKAKDLADTIYHEARHTEQWYRMAQLRAGQGLSAAAITTELGIPARIARLAKAAPLAPRSMQGVIAQGWWDSVYGAGSEHRDATLTEIERAATVRNAARARAEANPTPANQAALDRAQARFDRAFAAYRNLPEENDAWATGPAAAGGVTSGTGADAAATAAAAGVGGAEGAGGEAATASAAESAGESAGEAGATLPGAGAAEGEAAGSPPPAGGRLHDILPDNDLP